MTSPVVGSIKPACAVPCLVLGKLEPDGVNDLWNSISGEITRTLDCPTE